MAFNLGFDCCCCQSKATVCFCCPLSGCDQSGTIGLADGDYPVSWSLDVETDGACFHVSDGTLVMDTDGTITVTNPQTGDGWHFSYNINATTITDDETAQTVVMGDIISTFTLTNPWEFCDPPVDPVSCDVVSIKTGANAKCPCFQATITDGIESVDCDSEIPCPVPSCDCADLCGGAGNPISLNTGGFSYDVGCHVGGPDDGGAGLNGEFLLTNTSHTDPCDYHLCGHWTVTPLEGDPYEQWYEWFVEATSFFSSSHINVILQITQPDCEAPKTQCIQYIKFFDCSLEGFEQTTFEIPFNNINTVLGFDTGCWDWPASVTISCPIMGLAVPSVEAPKPKAARPYITRQIGKAPCSPCEERRRELTKKKTKGSK
jgi:hypothetical protein